jgi:hypothetical protein
LDSADDSLVASVEVKNNMVAMPLAPSFKEYYSHYEGDAGGERNVKAFNEAMDFETNEHDSLRAFNNADGITLENVEIRNSGIGVYANFAQGADRTG